MSDLDAFLDDVNRSQFGWRDSIRFTYDKTRELLRDGIPGDLVECGVAAGAHPAVMARACIDAGETRTVRLFDSFEGIPMGGERDRDWNEHYGDGTGALVSSGVTVCSEESVRANLARWFYDDDEWPFVFHAGWFQDTLPRCAQRARPVHVVIAPIAFLRLDGDLYESTKVCLEHLYPLVSKGGICVVDDLNLEGCREAVREYMVGNGLGDQVWHSITSSGDAWTVKA